MRVTKEILENKKVRLEICVDPETFEEGMQKAYLKNRKSISVPGFRKGKVPRKIVERFYGEEIFYEDAINEVFPRVYEEAVRETGIVPVDTPSVDISQIGRGQDLILTAEVDVKPDVELGQYKGIEIEKVEYTVSDDEVEHQLEHIAEENARWIIIENRGVQNGDLVTLDYAGTIDGEVFEGGTAEKQTLEIGSGRFIPGFEEQLIGLNLEEEKDITVTFPEDYHAEDLKGREAVFHVKIHEIKEKELPVLDDEFAKDVSEFSTLEEYKEDLKRKLQESADQNVRNMMEDQLVTRITENAKVDIPDVMVENEIDSMLQDMEMRLRYSGMNMEKYLQMSNTSIEEFRAQYKDSAYNRVKKQLVLEAVSKAEGIEVTEEDREKEYQKLAEQYKMNVDDIRKTFGNNSEHLDNSILAQKTVDILMEAAVMVEAKENSHEEHDHDHDGHDREAEEKKENED
ncbi:MAG TPA: trigger factor [Clostridiales bacterium]|nr:trigger factor [Clostridiales bacterium]